jgi:hypothetical protein
MRDQKICRSGLGIFSKRPFQCLGKIVGKPAFCRAGSAAGDGGNKGVVAAVAATPHSPICFRDCFAFVALIFITRR